MIPNLADPDRSQAVRWTAVQAIHAIENLREGRELRKPEIDTLRTLADDFEGIADWTNWVRKESVISGLFAESHRLNESVLRDASGFSIDEISHLRELAMTVTSVIDEQPKASSVALDAVEGGCALLITRLESYADSRDDLADSALP
jgi:hypothetical protein